MPLTGHLPTMPGAEAPSSPTRACRSPATGRSGPWLDGEAVQIHGMDADEFFAGEGDDQAAREIVDTVADADLFLWPSDQHLPRLLAAVLARTRRRRGCWKTGCRSSWAGSSVRGCPPDS